MGLFKKYIEKRIDKEKEEMIVAFRKNPMRFTEGYYGVRYTPAQKLFGYCSTQLSAFLCGVNEKYRGGYGKY